MFKKVKKNSLRTKSVLIKQSNIYFFKFTFCFSCFSFFSFCQIYLYPHVWILILVVTLELCLVSKLQHSFIFQIILVVCSSTKFGDRLLHRRRNRLQCLRRHQTQSLGFVVWMRIWMGRLLLPRYHHLLRCSLI